MKILAILYSGGTVPFPLYHRPASPWEIAMADFETSMIDVSVQLSAAVSPAFAAAARSMAEFERQIAKVYGMHDSV